MPFKTKLDPEHAPYARFSEVRERAGALDRTAGSVGAIDRMLDGIVIYEQVGESCVGEAQAQAASALSEIAGCRKQYSALAAYYYARIEEYLFLHPRPEDRVSFDPDSLEDNGTFPWASTEAWKQHGLPLEEDWGHEQALLNRPPSWGAAVEGEAHRTSQVYSVDSVDAQLLLDIEMNLRANHPVMLTIPVDPPLVQHTGADPIGPRDLTKRLGLHRLPILGMTAEGLLIAANSWGWDWGDGGVCYLTQELVVTQARNVTVLTAMPI